MKGFAQEQNEKVTTVVKGGWNSLADGDAKSVELGRGYSTEQFYHAVSLKSERGLGHDPEPLWLGPHETLAAAYDAATKNDHYRQDSAAVNEVQREQSAVAIMNALFEVRQAQETHRSELGGHIPAVIKDADNRVDAALTRLSENKEAMANPVLKGLDATAMKEAWSKGFGVELEKTLEAASKAVSSPDRSQSYWDKVASAASTTSASQHTATQENTQTKSAGRSR